VFANKHFWPDVPTEVEECSGGLFSRFKEREPQFKAEPFGFNIRGRGIHGADLQVLDFA
jgi:hypothetical protein